MQSRHVTAGAWVLQRWRREPDTQTGSFVGSGVRLSVPHRAYRRVDFGLLIWYNQFNVLAGS